jgi:hypothetical protein
MLGQCARLALMDVSDEGLLEDAEWCIVVDHGGRFLSDAFTDKSVHSTSPSCFPLFLPVDPNLVLLLPPKLGCPWKGSDPRHDTRRVK